MKKVFTFTLCLFALLSLNAQSINNLYVSPTGWVMWENGNSNSSYDIYLNNELVAQDLTTTYYQHNDLVDGQEYITKVVAGSSSAEYTWTKVACDNFKGVTDLSADVFDGKALIKWTLPTLDERISREGTWLHYDNGVYEEALCIIYPGEDYSDSICEPFKWGIMFPASDLATFAGMSLQKVSLYDNEAFNGEFFIYKGGTSEPETLVHSQKFTCSGSKDFYEITLNKQIEITGNDNIWVVFTHYDGWQPAAGCADQGVANGRWVYFKDYEDMLGSPWLDLAWISMPAFTWMIRAYVDETVVPTEVLGAMLYRNGELLTEEVTDKETFIDPNGKDGDEYTVRVVYGGKKDEVHYAMSCPQNVIFNTNSISNNDINNIMIYPNPTDGNLNINVVGMKHISIVNTLGQVVYDNNIDSNNEIIDMSQYNSGVYVVRIETENGVVIRQVSVKK